MVVRAPVALVALALTASPVAGQAYAPAAQFTEQLPPEARQAAATIDAFHEALRRGDTNAALAMLADDAVIYESGHAERKTEYAAHHLAADAAYAQAVPSTISRRTGGMTDALAWIATEGRTTGTFRNQQVDRSTAETALLRRDDGQWKIIHIHWSSAATKK